MSRALIATTHSPEYLIHKYWARKPCNIIAQYIDDHFHAGQFVVDPFAGSGVFLAEAKKRGLGVMGIDINPVAALLTDITLNPPDENALQKALSEIVELAGGIVDSFQLKQGGTIRYLVHSVVTQCGQCNNDTSATSAHKQGRRYICNFCGAKICFNLYEMLKTEIVEIATDEGIIKPSLRYKNEFATQNEWANLNRVETNNPYDKEIIENRRILAFPGMRSTDLFTSRNFHILTQLFDAAHKIKSRSVRNAVLLFLTSNTAQMSRLIPYRNGLKTGGQAWTVPGFWVPPMHLETNPLKHLQARSKKFQKGISHLHKAYGNSPRISESKHGDMREVLKKMAKKSVDGFFFDPPYGDSVPYLEFSFIWNIFLRSRVEYPNEIVVSDRSRYASRWKEYEKGIAEAVQLMSEKLKDGGKIIMTFNNLDPKAWKAILHAFKSSKLHCDEADYQIPAVVSSKAQFAVNTSYIGDFYCVFSKKRRITKHADRTDTIIRKLIPLFLERDCIVPQNVVKRVAILTILRGNINITLLDQLEDIIHGIAAKDGDNYVLRKEVVSNYNTPKTPRLRSNLISISAKLLEQGKMPAKEFYSNIIGLINSESAPTINELKNMLQGVVLFDQQYCYLQDSSVG